MPAKDKYHDVVKSALEREGWQITDDPYRIMLGKKKGFIDLAAEQLVAAEKEGQKIAVEPGRRSDKKLLATLESGFV